MPYEYLVAAYFKGLDFHQRDLHDLEKPVALQTAWHANSARDTKKRREPFKMDDFYLYQPKDERCLPEQRYGAAAKRLQEQGLYPVWALFCFPALLKVAEGAPPPLVAFLAEDAILLGPAEQEDGSWRGLLIAEKTAGNRTVSFRSPCGRVVRLVIPTITEEVIADEEIRLQCG